MVKAHLAISRCPDTSMTSAPPLPIIRQTTCPLESALSAPRNHLAGQYPHDGQGRDVQGDPSVGDQLVTVHLGPAAHHIPGTVARLDDDCRGPDNRASILFGSAHCCSRRQLVCGLATQQSAALHPTPPPRTSLCIQLTQHLADQLANALQGLEIVLRLVIHLAGLPDLVAERPHARVQLLMYPELVLVLCQGTAARVLRVCRHSRPERVARSQRSTSARPHQRVRLASYSRVGHNFSDSGMMPRSKMRRACAQGAPCVADDLIEKQRFAPRS